MVHLIICKKYFKVYVGNTIPSFRKRFNNHKSMVIDHKSKVWQASEGYTQGQFVFPFS